MDLRNFHPDPSSGRTYKTLDRLNSRTHPLACRWLDLIGWYNTSVRQCLLGHHRFYNNYKRHCLDRPGNLPSTSGYVLQRRMTFDVKYRFMRFFVLIYKMWGYPEWDMEIYMISRHLLYEKPYILQQFLEDAEADFDAALLHTDKLIRKKEFLNTAGNTPNFNNAFNIQLKNYTLQPIAFTQLQNQNTPAQQTETKDALPGKEKGILSKKQVLIYHDLLSQSSKQDRLDIGNPNKHEKIAGLLHALTGKTQTTWLKELDRYRNKGLYDCDSDNELKNLINTITNLDDILFNAGQVHLHKLAQKKIRELEQQVGRLSS